MLNGLDNEEMVTSALEACRKGGASKVMHHGADLSDPNQITQLFESVREHWGRTPDIVVNNAGEGPLKLNKVDARLRTPPPNSYLKSVSK
jgi:NAD(P)-dependent dehydrogenase (short-subunit alcohol dehydrogenase family)